MASQDRKPFRTGQGDVAKQTDRKPKGQTKVPAGKKGKGKVDEARAKTPTPRKASKK